nr:nicotinamide/nicotinic acid mononucleotide adenylyltransferase [Quercus suber]
MNAEDAIIAKKKKKGEQLDNCYIHHPEQVPCPKKAKVGEKKDRDDKKAGAPTTAPTRLAIDGVGNSTLWLGLPIKAVGVALGFQAFRFGDFSDWVMWVSGCVMDIPLPFSKLSFGLIGHEDSPGTAPKEKVYVVLVANGSFNPPTYMHLRMFEFCF